MRLTFAARWWSWFGPAERQAIDASAKVDARHRQQNARLRGGLDHKVPQPDRNNCDAISVAALGAISSCSPLLLRGMHESKGQSRPTAG